MLRGIIQIQPLRWTVEQQMCHDRWSLYNGCNLAAWVAVRVFIFLSLEFANVSEVPKYGGGNLPHSQ